MNSGLNHLLEEYGSLERDFRLIDSTDKYKLLVTANGNQSYPVQRWFHFKEAFSLQLLETLLEDWSLHNDSVNRLLDPFCGAGTTLLSAQMFAKKHRKHDMEIVGVERNPFLHFVSDTKTSWYRYAPQNVKRVSDHLLNGGTQHYEGSWPSLSTLHNEEVYEPSALRRLMEFRKAINDEVNDIEVMKPLLLGYAAILESVSGVRKDGRALRVVPDKRRLPVDAALESSWNSIIGDLDAAQDHYHPLNARVVLGDGRTLSNGEGTLVESERFDLIFYSPPYLNNIDYTEVYKLELWLAGFVQEDNEFRSLRSQTVRSHPSVRFHDPITISEDPRLTEVNSTLEALIEALPQDKNLSWRKDLFPAYFDDMYVSLKHQIDVLAPGGWIFCVVGNSR